MNGNEGNKKIDEFFFQYGLSFYLHYLTRWPECFFVAENPAQRLMGYSKLNYVRIEFH